MKIRWSHDAIRLRITPTDLEQIAARKAVVETLAIDQATAWKLSILPGAGETRLSAAQSGVEIHLSDSDCAKLANEDEIGVYFKHGDLRYYIEKDFPCEHPCRAEAMEPETETFSKR